MKKTNHNKKESGITLIALVITIIVLLILAGISISMLSGENSILKRAGDAKEQTERQQIIETARIDILGKQAENHRDLSEEELEEILTSDDYKTKGTLSNEENILERTLTSKDEKYHIPVSEIYNGTLFIENASYSDEIKTKLAEGKYVTYNNKPYVVLYNDDNGIEIIAMETMGNITLGAGDENIPQTATGYDFTGENSNFEKARWSYNNAIETLNKATEKLFQNDGIIDDARCVGSVPGKTNGISNKNKKNGNLYVHDSYNEKISVYDNKFEQGEELVDRRNGWVFLVNNPNYSDDFYKIGLLGIENIYTEYWIGSRYTIIDGNGIGVHCRYVSAPNYSDPGGTLRACSILYTGSEYEYYPGDGPTYGIRPIFHLATSVKIKNDGGDGSSTKPFSLE